MGTSISHIHLCIVASIPMASAVLVHLACFHSLEADAVFGVQAKKRKQLAAAERGAAKGKAKPTRSADEDVPRKAQRSSKGGPIFDDESDGVQMV